MFLSSIRIAADIEQYLRLRLGRRRQKQADWLIAV